MANYFFIGAFAFLVGVLIGFLLSLGAQTRLGVRADVKKHTDEAFGKTSYRAQVETSPVFDVLIQNLSPTFCKIYTESTVVERDGLLQVCGVGYGKALEFLIKDYAKTENPDHKA